MVDGGDFFLADLQFRDVVFCSVQSDMVCVTSGSINAPEGQVFAGTQRKSRFYYCFSADTHYRVVALLFTAVGFQFLVPDLRRLGAICFMLYKTCIRLRFVERVALFRGTF